MSTESETLSDDEFFTEEMSGPGWERLTRRANFLTENDTEYVLKLIEIRKAREISVNDLARMLGQSEKWVTDFESYWYDPKLSELRRYAHCVGALVDHQVTIDPAEVEKDEKKD